MNITEWIMNGMAKQVLELNNITEPNFIKAGETLKIPIYIDKGAKVN